MYLKLILFCWTWNDSIAFFNVPFHTKRPKISEFFEARNECGKCNKIWTFFIHINFLRNIKTLRMAPYLKSLKNNYSIFEQKNKQNSNLETKPFLNQVIYYSWDSDNNTYLNLKMVFCKILVKWDEQSWTIVRISYNATGTAVHTLFILSKNLFSTHF